MKKHPRLFEKKLPMNVPTLNTYNLNASLFSLVENDDDQAWNWIMNNFIQIFYINQFKSYFFDTHQSLYTQCPWVDSYCIPKQYISQKWACLQEFIIEQVNDNRYIWLNINQFFLPQSNHYLKNIFIHELFIYGYDSIKNTVYIADNLSNGKYTLTECNFNDLELAFWNVPSNTNFTESVYLFKKKTMEKHDFNINRVKFSLNCFLTSTDTYQTDLIDNCIYGVSAIDILLSDIKESKDHKSFDLRPYHLLWERSSLMLFRLDYMHQHLSGFKKDTVFNMFKKQEGNYLIIRNLLIKQQLKPSSEILDSVYDKLSENIILEKENTEKLLEILYSY